MSNPFDKYDEPTENPFDRFDENYSASEKPKGSQKSAARSLVEGAALGISDIGNTALNVLTYLPGKVSPGIAQWNRTRDADFEALTEENKDSTAFQVGRIGANIASTLPVGGVLAKAASKVGAAPALVNSIRTGGFRTGSPAASTLGGKALDLGTRAAGGAITGGASAALVDPEQADAGALIGGVLPVGISAVGKSLNYLGRSGHSIVAPYTEKGREKIAGRIMNKFADGGPTSIDARELVPGSLPTLAEATANPGLATLQRVTRDINPNRFVDREKTNAAARVAAFQGMAGDGGAIDAAKIAREEVTNPMYSRAFTADRMRQNLATEAQKARAPFAGVGLSGGREDLATPGLRNLASRPQFKSAVDDARKLAANNGVRLDDPLQSLQGLHYIKLALDDALNPQAKSNMGKNASRAIMDMRDKLADELAEISPLYGAAKKRYAEMSKPVSEMEALQGLKLTDKADNITLARAQSSLRGVEAQRRLPGVNKGKAISEPSLETLRNIRNDLLRQDNTNLGRSAGSSTLQNIATDNILSTVLPGRVGEFVSRKGGNDLFGQVGRLAYSGPNEKIREGLLDMMLDPKKAEQAMRLANQLPGPSRVGGLLEQAHPWLLRSGPLLGSDQ